LVGEARCREAVGPLRTCVGCRTTRRQTELLRLARTPSGVRFDPRGRQPGRGAYLCPDPRCIDAAARRGATSLRRALRGAPETEIREALDALRTEAVQHHQVQTSTVRSENA
jgi:uncharacterized protein